MNIQLETELSLGQTLYYLSSKNKTIYAPCPLCKNERKVTASVGTESFQFDCPRCTGNWIKGDIRQYSLEETSITSFCYGKNAYEKGDITWRCRTTRFNEIFIENLIEDSNYSPRQMYTDNYSPRQMYTDKKLAVLKMKELNKAEKLKADVFLEKFKSN